MQTVKSTAPATNKFFNGETVNYGICFFAVSFLFVIIKQLLKLSLSVSAGVAVSVSAGLCAAVLFLLEKKYVFLKPRNKSILKQIIFYIFQCAVDVGFFKICSYIFTDLLQMHIFLSFFICASLLLFFNYYFGRILVFDCVTPSENRRNGRALKLVWDNRFVLISALIAFVVFVFVKIFFSIFPIGTTVVLRMDLYHQYGPLFVELFDRVTNLKTFLYSWRSGGGSSFLGNYFNYLSSPLSFIILLYDRKDMGYAITTMFLVKGLLSASSFTYYAKASLKQHSIVTACFGCFYAFCAYFLAYYWNIMWIDGMILFPLIILGIERIINHGKPLTYIASLTVLLYASYYIGYMVCIFSVIYFFAYFILRLDNKMPAPKFKKIPEDSKPSALRELLSNKLFNRGLLFAGSSVLCGLLCAINLIPVYRILQNASATSDTAPTVFESYFDILNLISSHMIGLETTIRSSGNDVLPNIFCGIITVLLLPIYLSNRHIRVREKAVYVFLILFFVVSFDNNWFNFIWHAFHFPNDLPYRFSFMYSFITLVVALKAFARIKQCSYRDIAFSGMIWVLVLIIIQKFPTEKMSEPSVYISLALIMVWTGLLLAINKGKLDKSTSNILICFLVLVELIVSTNLSFLISVDNTVYCYDYDSHTEAVEYIHDNDDGFYKEELSRLNTRMDPCLYGYNGMSIFSSMAYEDYSAHQKDVGMYGNNINSYTYNLQTPIYNLMYNLKYIMKVKDDKLPLSEDFYTELYTTSDGDTVVYENNYFLPIAFEVSSDIENWTSDFENPFDSQQSFISSASGASDMFIPVEYEDTKTYEINCENITQNGTYYFTKTDEESTTGSIDITISGAQDGNVYLYLNSPEVENADVYFYDSNEETHMSISDPYILDLGWHEKDEQITVSLECGSIDGTSSYVDIYAYNIDKEEFEAAYQLLSLGGMQVDSYSDTKVSGTVEPLFPMTRAGAFILTAKRQKTL